MASVLVSGVQSQVSLVAAALRERGAQVTEVDDLADIPSICSAAGAGAFDAYVQLGASFKVVGDTAVQRQRHFYADGVLARFIAFDGAKESLKPGANVLLVLGQHRPEVTTRTEREARRALTEVLAQAAQADAGPGGLRVRVLDATTEPDRLAALALGVTPRLLPIDLDELSPEDWRIELMSVVFVET